MIKEKSGTEAAPYLTPSQANECYKYKQFSGKSITQWRVFSALLPGRKMSVVELTDELRIPDPRSAIRDLRNAGVPIADEWVKSQYSRYKLYYIHKSEESEVNNG